MTMELTWTDEDMEKAIYAAARNARLDLLKNASLEIMREFSARTKRAIAALDARRTAH